MNKSHFARLQIMMQIAPHAFSIFNGIVAPQNSKVIFESAVAITTTSTFLARKFKHLKTTRYFTFGVKVSHFGCDFQTL